MGEDNCNSSNLMNTSTDSTGNYSSEFNGFAELISPKSIKAECQTDCAYTPADNNCTSYTDISYNTKPSSRLSTEINDVFVKRETEIDLNNGQSTSNHYEKSTDERLREQYVGEHETTQKVDYNKINNEPASFHQRIELSNDYHQKCNIMDNVLCPPLIPTNAPPTRPPASVKKSFENIPKVNGGITTTPTAKSDRLTSSLRLIRKPSHHHRQSSSLFPMIKTRKLSIRLDRSIVDDFLSSKKKSTVRMLQPIVMLKRLEDEENELNSVKQRSKSSRNGKRKQNRAIWDGDTVKDKKTFKRRRDDMDDAEGSSGFTGGSSGSGYSSDSQNGTSGTNDSVDSPPPKSTTGGANDSTELELVSCKHWNFFYFSYFVIHSSPLVV